MNKEIGRSLPGDIAIASMEVAGKIIEGKEIKEIAKYYSTTQKKIRQVRDSEPCQEILQEILKSSVEMAKLRYRARFNSFMAYAMKALEHQLTEKNDMQAVKLVFKTAGLLQDEDQQAGNDKSTFHIHMPDGVNTVNVKED